MGDFKRSGEWVFLLVSACAVVVCALATWPVVEMGLNDDWSYTFIARELARTGHFHYDGWATVIIGVQAWWAALLVRLFGFSFTLVRLSTLPFAAGCGVLIYLLGRFAGLNRALALFGTLVVTTSPLFIPLAASFMTDVAGLFFWLLSIYAALVAVGEEKFPRACGWLFLCAAAGVAGGSVRQVVWLAPAAAIPVVVWIRRRDRRFVSVAAVLWGAAGLGSWLCLRWFNSQPYVQLQEFSVTPDDVFSVDALGTLARLGYGAVMFCLPALAMYFGVLGRWRELGWRLAAGMAAMAALLAAFILTHPGWTMMGNIVTSAGIMPSGTDVMGGKPTLLGDPVVFTIRALMSIGGAAAMALFLWNRRRIEGTRFTFLAVFGAASVFYLGLVFYRSLDAGIMFDRYLLEVLPLAITLLLAEFQERIRSSAGVTGWCAVFLFAVYGVAVTHDAFAGDRARVKAASALVAAGIQRTRITAGLEYDGWTELEQTGYINSDDIQTPPHAYKAQDARKYPMTPAYWFWESTPSVEPAYFVTYQPVKGLRTSSFPAVPFTAWLPPFRREAITEIVR